MALPTTDTVNNMSELEKRIMLNGGQEEWDNYFPSLPYDPKKLSNIRSAMNAQKMSAYYQEIEEDRERARMERRANKEAKSSPNYAVDPFTRYAMMRASIDPSIFTPMPSFTDQGVDQWAASNAHLFGTNGKGRPV